MSEKLKKLGYGLYSGAGGAAAGIRLKLEGMTGSALDYVGAAGVGGTKMLTKV